MFQLDDKTLRHLRNRDAALLTMLFQEINPYLMRMLGAQRVFNEEAEDIVFNTWQTFFEAIEAFEGRSEIKSFLGGILINKLRECRRAKARTIPEEDPETILGNSFTPEGWWKRENSDPSELVAKRQARALIGECLDGLSDKQKEAFILREIQGEESVEICKILGVSISNLGVLLFRAKEKLRLCLEGRIHIEQR